VGQAEAAIRLRELNSAYQLLRDTLSSDGIACADEHAFSQENVSETAVISENAQLDRSKIESTVEAINASGSCQFAFRSLWADRWNRCSALLAATYLIVVAVLCWSRSSYETSVRSSLAPVGALVLISILLPLIWFGDRFTRFLASAFLLFFTVALPVLAAVMVYISIR
jgi:hypothetical protein